MNEERNWFFEFKNEWQQLFGRYNWYTFHLWMFEIENDKIMGGLDVTFILLGLGVRWRWNHTVTEERAALIQQVKDIKDEYHLQE